VPRREMPPPPPGTRAVHEQVLEVLAGRRRYEEIDHPDPVRVQDGVSIVGQGRRATTIAFTA
jgi:hypothetical protein